MLGPALKQVMFSAVLAKSMDAAKQFRRVILIYDVACQFSIMFKTRFGRSFPDFDLIVDLIYFLVAKMHLFSHIDDCGYRYNRVVPMAKGSRELVPSSSKQGRVRVR